MSTAPNPPALNTSRSADPDATQDVSRSVSKLYSANVFVNDVDRAIEFYVRQLGLELRGDTPFDDSGHRWVEVAPKGAETALVLVHGFGNWRPEGVGGDTGLIFSVDSMADTFRTLQAQGVAFKGEPENTPYGIFAHVTDPDGNILTFHEAATT